MPIYVDADGCPVKEETYKVAARHGVPVFVVANKPIRVPSDPLIEMVVVSAGFDAADDWIVERAGACDLVITSDILLADRCIKKQARVLGPKGKELTEDNIGNAVSTRELMTHLRQTGDASGGPAPMSKTDRSRFLAKLNELLHALRRQQK